MKARRRREYFQTPFLLHPPEWAPLFPVLHRPTFLKLYEDYTANPEKVEDKQAIAQLNLVFGIAALSAEVHT